MAIYIVRHGETARNRAKVLQGRSNAPLNENGISQCESVRDYFRENGIAMDMVFSSPLERAISTAEIIAGDDAEVVCDDRLLEMDYGPYEGTSLEDPAPEIIEFFSDFVNNPAPEGMESLAHVTARLGDFIEEIYEGIIRRSAGADVTGPDHADVNILISTHAIAMKGALEYLTPESGGSYWSRYIGNCSVYRAEVCDDHIGVPEEIFSLTYEPGV